MSAESVNTSRQWPRQELLSNKRLIPSQISTAAMSLAAMDSSQFLRLPLEIRDQIYQYAFAEDQYDAEEVRASSGYRIKRIPIGNGDRWQWEANHYSKAPIPEYLCLMLCSSQLHNEVEDFLRRLHQDQSIPAKLIMQLEYQKMWPTWVHYPDAPQKVNELDILLNLNHMYHPAYITQGSQNAILSAVSDTLKRYIYRGPHLARPSPLRHRLHIETVRITLAPHIPFAEMTHIYGSPKGQLDSLFTNFRTLLTRFCRSGIPWGLIDTFEVRIENKPWFFIPVTSNIWDEQDFVFFQYGGFNWDASETTTVAQPDMVAW